MTGVFRSAYRAPPPPPQAFAPTSAIVSVNLTPDAGQIIITGYAPTLDVGAALVVYDWFIRVRRRRRS